MPQSDTSFACAEICVNGSVQGVGYRYFVVQEAVKLGIVGWVQNYHDGSVKIIAEATQLQLETFITQLKIGPALALVEECSVIYHTATGGYQGFIVKR